MQMDYNEYLDTHIKIWNALDAGDNAIKHKWSPIQSYKQIVRYYQLKYKLNKVCKTVLKDSKLTPASHDQLVSLVSLWLNINAKSMRKTILGDYIETTKEFIRRVKDKWPEMDDDSVFQALRNVWIMNTIQMMAGHAFELTDAMFAYSMLYPLTDNLIDSVDINMHDKRTFVINLGKRLRGEVVNPIDPQESDVFEMISLIEAQYPRQDYKAVYESLLLIHEAQLYSLKQQSEPLSDDVLLRLTFDKGASSVVADGYLVLGNLTDRQLDFLVGYGIVLQLADDLQDMTIDVEAKHATLFSHAKSSEVRVQTLHKLRLYSSMVLDKIFSEDTSITASLKSLLGSSMNVLIGDAVYEQSAYFSKSIVRSVEIMQTVKLAHHANLKVIGNNWMQKLGDVDF